MIIDQKTFILNVRCPLYLFIRQHMHECGPTTSVADRNSTRFRLVEPISCNDDFGTWSYDHWQGLFDFELKPHEDNVQFPERWCLADDVTIHLRMETCNSREKTSISSHADTPRTASLDLFVQDVCTCDNNGQSGSWLNVLNQEAIYTFEHLTNLNQSEWDSIRKLPVNAKRMLKAAVDRARTSIDSERRRQVIKDLNDGNKEDTESFITKSLFLFF